MNPTRRFWFALAAAFAGLVSALPAAAQNALTFYGGYVGGGSFEQAGSSTNATADLASGA